MTVTYGFYDSLAGDRKYTAAQMSRLFEGIIEDGVFASVGDLLAVTADGGSNMNVVVGSGRAWFNFTWTNNDAPLTLMVTAASVALPRIDTVVLEVNTDSAVRANAIKIIAGTPASSPVPPTLANTSTLKQYPLADIAVGTGVTSINNANITNRIGTTATPWVTGPLTAVDASILYTQLEAEFDAWFSDLQNELDANQASNLQNQINVLYAQEGGWIGIPHTMSHVSVDGATGVANFNGDVRTYLSRGMRLKYQQDQALSAYWNLDANSNSQVGSFNGTDTAVSYSAGKFSNAATFNGTTSKTVIADNASLKPTGEFTIGLWVKTTSSDPYLFQSWSSNPNFAGFALHLNSGKPTLTIGSNTSAGETGYSQIAGTTAINDNAWHYLVATFKPNWVQIYVDGKLVASGYSTNPGYAATNYVRIGCGNSSGADTNFLSGQIDDVFLINGYALDQNTIVDKYVANSAQGSATITVTKHGIITDVGFYSGGNTPVTFWGGTDFALVNGTITNPYYSPVKVPYGFNPDPKKWRAYFADDAVRTKATPVTSTWYWSDLGSRKLDVPIGAWDLRFSSEVYCQVSALTVVIVSVALSRLNNSPTDPELRSRMLGTGHSATEPYVGLNTSGQSRINLSAKTSFYLIYRHESSNIAYLTSDGSSGNPAQIIADCAYL